MNGIDAYIEELQIKLRNFKRTRALSARSLHPWCDMLIRETQLELDRVTGAGGSAEMPKSEHAGDVSSASA